MCNGKMNMQWQVVMHWQVAMQWQVGMHLIAFSMHFNYIWIDILSIGAASSDVL